MSERSGIRAGSIQRAVWDGKFLLLSIKTTLMIIPLALISVLFLIFINNAVFKKGTEVMILPLYGSEKLKELFGFNSQCLVPSFSLFRGRARTWNWEFLKLGLLAIPPRGRISPVKKGPESWAPLFSVFPFLFSKALTQLAAGRTPFPGHRGMAKVARIQSMVLTSDIFLIAYYPLLTCVFVGVLEVINQAQLASSWWPGHTCA